MARDEAQFRPQPLKLHCPQVLSPTAVTVPSDLSPTVLAEACAGDIPKVGADIVVTAHGDVG
jgi:hypothetical protein